MELADIDGASIAKRLASCKQSSRNRAVLLLCSWLPKRNGDPSSASGVSDSELIKIWKGLFFCVWHSDRLANQVELINRLAALLSSLPPQLAGRYLESFLITIRREWSGIDFLRLDKFYLLIRRFLRHVLVVLRNNSWNIELTARIADILSQGSLLSVDKFPAAGVNYHIAEIFLDEIAEFLPLEKEIVDLLLNPFFLAMQTTTDKVLVNKIKVNIFDRWAVNGSNLLSNVDGGSDVEKFGKIALLMGFSKKFLTLASATETQQGNRKVLFDLHERYLKLDKELEKSGLDISLKPLDNGRSVPECECDMETTQVLNANSCSDNGPIEAKKKKKKKANEPLDRTETNSMIKKKKTLSSSTKSNGVDLEEMSRSKKKKKKLVDLSVEGTGTEATIHDSRPICNHENSNLVSSDNNDIICFDDTLLSNLQKQFEKVAAEAGMTSGSIPKVSKKRKREMNADNKKLFLKSENVDLGSENGKNGEKNVKKVRFSMNKNLIWKPQNPLPPQNLRLPPSVTPRGSALKKGLSPGPIRESPPTVKKIKVKGSSLKKGRRAFKAASPAHSRTRYMRLIEWLKFKDLNNNTMEKA
ncbi:ribosomal RNA processing protein 1 homolog [Phalaenopsis equestris]|uniref:ribosomal RNA processing protein 1 homolog n=1 Tax=Phalaenopsis equestris TaxID=78828 RepID=UPI0009E3C2A8|nr:ribosomal RNA processing protein 1 homolog [Phalaenopsis equestris]